ncbi:hypothetical protein [Pleionea sp. CnH1-48]|uniref:hypothetical protein n=1 Tax=Pleionea sp. CnH1-48 TaxID=2954494 RepID=UPI0020981D76|nr:hypothetical protein [Pleionea sp. CnH1-48]MCO7227188.1 hypothetical protein [Pleionea sp. CnH1-48]
MKKLITYDSNESIDFLKTNSHTLGSSHYLIEDRPMNNLDIVEHHKGSGTSSVMTFFTLS